MEVVKKVEVRSFDAEWILNKKLKNGVPMFEVALIKLSRLYESASHKYSLYAFMVLNQFFEKIFKTKQKIEKVIAEYENTALHQKVDLSAFKVNVKKTYELKIGVALGGELIALIETYDRLMVLLSIIDKINLFKSRNKFFEIARIYHCCVVDIFREILSLNEVQLPLVTIEQYLNNDPAYLNAAKVLGEVKPAELFAVLNIDILPKIPAALRNVTLFKLKQMG